MKTFQKYTLPDKPLCLLNFQNLLIFSLANGQIATFFNRKFVFIFDNKGITIGCLVKCGNLLIAGDWKGNLICLLRKYKNDSESNEVNSLMGKTQKSNDQLKLSPHFEYTHRINITDHLIKALLAHKNKIFVSISSNLHIYEIVNHRLQLYTIFNLNNKILSFTSHRDWVLMGMSVPGIFALNEEDKSGKIRIFELECKQEAGIINIFTDGQNHRNPIRIKRLFLEKNFLPERSHENTLAKIKSSQSMTDFEKLLPQSVYTSSSDRTIYKNNHKHLICEDLCRKIDKKYYTNGNKLISRETNQIIQTCEREIIDFCIYNSLVVIAALDCTLRVETNIDLEDELEELRQFMS